MAADLPEGPCYSRHSSSVFAALPHERRAAQSFFKIGRLFSLISCLSLARLRLLLFMSNNVHPQPWSLLSLVSVGWKCDLSGQVSAMLHLLQMGPSKALTTFPLQI